MSIIRLTKIFHFEMAHALNGYDGLCRNIHGHSYELRVTVKGCPLDDASSPKNGMVMDFGDLKRIVNEQIVDRFDHALVLWNHASLDLIALIERDFEKVHVVEYQPTSERLIADFAARLQQALPPPVKLHSILLQETPGSFAEWFAEDNGQ